MQPRPLSPYEEKDEYHFVQRVPFHIDFYAANPARPNPEALALKPRWEMASPRYLHSVAAAASNHNWSDPYFPTDAIGKALGEPRIDGYEQDSMPMLLAGMRWRMYSYNELVVVLTNCCELLPADRDSEELQPGSPSIANARLVSYMDRYPLYTNWFVHLDGHQAAHVVRPLPIDCARLFTELFNGDERLPTTYIPVHKDMQYFAAMRVVNPKRAFDEVLEQKLGAPLGDLVKTVMRSFNTLPITYCDDVVLNQYRHTVDPVYLFDIETLTRGELHPNFYAQRHNVLTLQMKGDWMVIVPVGPRPDDDEPNDAPAFVCRVPGYDQIRVEIGEVLLLPTKFFVTVNEPHRVHTITLVF